MLQKIKDFLFKNSSTKQTVAKNTFWLSVSNFGGRLIKAAVIIYAARMLGTAGYGVFSYAMTLAGFFTLFIDPGINGIVMRDITKSDASGRLRILSTTLVMKIALIAFAVIIILFVAPSFSTLPGATLLLPVVAVIIVFDSMREFFSSFIRAHEKMEWEAGIFLLTNVGILIAGLAFLFHSPTPLSLGWGYAIGTVLGALVATWTLRSYLKNIFTHFSKDLILPILRSAWPFAITGALGSLLTSADILIVSWMRTASDVGIYAAAIRIIQVLYLLPIILQFSALPALARLANKDDQKFRRALERTIGFIFVASVPMAVGGAILGTSIMTFMFGSAYASGGLALKILMVTMLVDYPAAIVSTAIFAYDNQRSLIICSAIGGTANVVFDLLLIPRWGITGSAIGTLLAQTISNWYLWHTMKKINTFKVIPHLKKIAASGIVMGIATGTFYLLGVNVVLNILLSVPIYFAALYLLREPILLEIASVISPASEVAVKA